MVEKSYHLKGLKDVVEKNYHLKSFKDVVVKKVTSQRVENHVGRN